MKKIYLSSLLAAGVLAFASNAGAIDSTGCGLGSMAWRGQSGIGHQVLAATTMGLSERRLSALLSEHRAVIRTGALPAEPAE